MIELSLMLVHGVLAGHNAILADGASSTLTAVTANPNSQDRQQSQ
jgi:hypothetical protein